jgi:hypothetical protein
MGWLMGNKSWKDLKNELKNPLPIKRAPLAHDESIVNSFVVSRDIEGLPAVGGILDFTNKGGYVFNPVDTDSPRRILKAAGTLTGDPVIKAASRATDALAKKGFLDSVRLPVTAIQSASPNGKTGVTVQRSDGTIESFHVSASTWTPVWSKKNEIARNRLLEQMKLRSQ